MINSATLEIELLRNLALYEEMRVRRAVVCRHPPIVIRVMYEEAVRVTDEWQDALESFLEVYERQRPDYPVAPLAFTN